MAWLLGKLYDFLVALGEEDGPYGHCLNCGGPVTRPYVTMDCPRRPLVRRLAFRLLCRMGWAGGFGDLRHGQLRRVPDREIRGLPGDLP